MSHTSHGKRRTGNKPKEANYGDWVLDRDGNVRQIRGCDDYRSGRVSLLDVDGKFVCYAHRKDLTPLDLSEAFTTRQEQQYASRILDTMGKLFMGSISVEDLKEDAS